MSHRPSTCCIIELSYTHTQTFSILLKLMISTNTEYNTQQQKRSIINKLHCISIGARKKINDDNNDNTMTTNNNANIMI